VNRIDVLPDDVLLEIFDFYVDMSPPFARKRDIEEWQTLVHVCRRWRSLVFQSPRRLNLRLYCTPNTPAKDTLDTWPALPLIVKGSTGFLPCDNVIAALGQSDRVCKVDLMDLAKWQLDDVLATMQVPFPELTDLRLMSHAYDKTLPTIPDSDSFLGGSAPRLRILSVSGIRFPGLPKLLLSTTHLAQLWLSHPGYVYISPESVIAVISSLSSLGTLSLEFDSSQSSRPVSQSPSLPPLERSVLPALKRLYFTGVAEYLQDLVTRIDAPQLNEMGVIFFNHINFDCTRLAQFIDRTPTLREHDEERVQFHDTTAGVKLRSRTSQSGLKSLEIAIACGGPDLQLSFIEQFCNNSLPPLSTVEDLYIEHKYWEKVWKSEDTLWLQLLLPFTTVKNLYVSKQFAAGIAATLRELVGGGITVVLPSLQSIFVEGLEESGPVPENIAQFVAARQLSGHPVAISVWR
jgi:hypothetical protein